MTGTEGLNPVTKARVVETSIDFARGFRAGCSANVTDEQDLLRKLKSERNIYLIEKFDALIFERNKG